VVSNRFPRAIRISCHAHGNAGPKYAFDMLPGGARAVSPVRERREFPGICTDIISLQWHNVMFRKVDGSYAVGHYRSFDPATYDVVSRYGRPYYLQERSSSSDVISQAAVVPDPSDSFPLKSPSEIVNSCSCSTAIITS